MRITREILLKIARDAAAERARISRRLVCIYLVGSVISEEQPLLGGVTDVDLVVIHDTQPVQGREVQRLTDEISLDVSHYSQDLFRQPRHLRVDPWMGPFIYNKPLVLHDAGHWFDYNQAAVGAQFMQPDNVLSRSRSLADLARESWTQLNLGQSPTDQRRRVYGFLKALENAGNAVASLAGLPLTERRFLVQFPQRMAALGKPELSDKLLSLLAGDVEVEDETWTGWTRQWEQALQAAGAQGDYPPRLDPARINYYTRAATALWEEHPTAAFWLLIRTWTLAVSHLPADSPAILPWQEAIQAVGLDKAHFPQRLDALDAYLDSLDEVLDDWGRKNGAANT